jgi:aminopeptidase N
MSVMVRDSLESSHSVKFEVFDPDEVRTLFDEISYDKGSSIIRMMNAFLTEATTKKGLTVRKTLQPK